MISIITEIRRVAASHYRNGERSTADLLERAADHIMATEDLNRKLRKRLERIGFPGPDDQAVQS